MATSKKPRVPQWRNLHHAKGTATRIPELVRQLVGPRNPSLVESPDWLLRAALVGPRRGAWFTASPRAVTLLLESVAIAHDPVAVLMLAADVLGGDQLRAWLSNADATDEHEAAARDAAVACGDTIMGALSSEHGPTRAAAAMLLATVPELASTSLRILVSRANADPDDLARAGAVLALGRLGLGDTSAEASIERARARDQPAIVRGAAAMAWLRHDETRRFGEVVDELAAWLAYAPDAELPWFKAPSWYRELGFPDPPARALAGLARARGPAACEELADVAVALAAREDGVVEAQLAKVLLDLGGFTPEGPSARRVLLAEELTPTQRAMALRLAHTHLLPAGGYGLPASGGVRRRWLGIEPPGPLEQLVGGQPTWRAWTTRIPAHPFATPIDRWQAWLESMSGSYPPMGWGPTLEELPGELDAAGSSPELLERVRVVADDLAARQAASERTRMIAHLQLRTSRMLLVPWVRAGRPIPPTWDVMVYLGTEPEARALFALLPLERRARLLVRHLDRPVLPTLGGATATVLALVDLAPTRAVGDAIRTALVRLAPGPFGPATLERLAPRFAELVAKHPSLGDM